MTGAAEPKLLAGNWGGPGANLTFDAQGGRLQQDCASASFGPIRIDAKGRFKTSGHFETYGPGPQSADKSSATSATFEGLVRGETLQLTIRPTGGAAQTLTLQQGRRMKIIRCY
jgi:hypothetical protein